MMSKTNSKKKIYKADIVKMLSQKTSLSIAASNEVTNALVETIIDNLKQGHDVSIFGFGSFQVVDRKARNGINPSTRERFVIPARKAISFKASSVLKKAARSSE